MYESFYSLQCDPFRLRPDPRFAWAHDAYARARSSLEYGFMRGEGIVVVTGGPGTGKSALVDDVLAAHDDPGLRVERVLTTQSEVGDFLRLVAFAFGLEPERTDKTSSLIEIQSHLQSCAANAQRVLLIIDEAQNLSRESLEELRLLDNIQGESGVGLQLFLLGQPALRECLLGESMEQLRQRIIAYCHLEPLSAAATREYVCHRLETAGWRGDPAISGEALTLIHRYSRGTPRRINLLCSRLLLAGFAEDRHRLTARDVRAVMTELAPEMVESEILAQCSEDQAHPRKWRRGNAALALAAGETAAAMLLVPDADTRETPVIAGLDRPLHADQPAASPTPEEPAHEAPATAAPMPAATAENPALVIERVVPSQLREAGSPPPAYGARHRRRAGSRRGGPARLLLLLTVLLAAYGLLLYDTATPRGVSSALESFSDHHSVEFSGSG